MANTNEICTAIQLMGSEMTQEQQLRTMNEIKQVCGQEDVVEIEHASLLANSPIYADLRQFKAEMNW